MLHIKRSIYARIPEVSLEILLSGFQNDCNYQGKLKGGAYSSSISLKEGIWGTVSPRSYKVTLFLKSKNYGNHEIYITHSHIIVTISVKYGYPMVYRLLGWGVVGGAYHKIHVLVKQLH